MSRQPVSVGGRADAAELRNVLLGRLGLRENASDADVETAHNGLVEFLELAPRGVKSWAAARTTDVDEAFALLSGPEQDLVAATQLTTMAQDGPVKTPHQPPAAAPAGPGASAAFAAGKPGRNKMMWAAVPLLVIAVVFAVFQMGRSDVPGFSGKPTGQETTAAASGATPVDQAKLAALMAKIAANPKDIASLQGIGDLYFAATDYKNASLWEQKILAVDPKNQVGLLALGAAQFNLGNAAEAKKTWLIAAGLYPKNAEVHYDLGFLYMSATPPDSANMQAEWKKVVAIDPNSNLAKTVATHLKSLQSPSPSASVAPSPK
ncbi:MAG: tetratricopeptide repeat protein [Dermatophilaceae bacterium]